MTVAVGYCVSGLPVVHLDWMHSLMGLRGIDSRLCVQGGTVVTNRNDLVRKFLADTDCDKLLMTDVDGTFEPDALERLIECDRPIVGALAFAGKLGGSMYPTIYGIRRNQAGERSLYFMPSYPKDSLIQVHATGCHFLLVDRAVLEAIGKRMGDSTAYPWFEDVAMMNGGRLAPVSEDVTFCMRAGLCDYETWVHTGIKTGHLKVGALEEWQYDAINEGVHLAENPELVRPSTDEVRAVNREQRRALVAAGRVPR